MCVPLVVPVGCPAPLPSTTAACGSGFNSGNIITTYNTGPAPACAQNPSVSNTCSCSLTPTTTSTACGAGYQPGSYTITNTPNVSCSGYNTTNNQSSVCVPLVVPVTCPPPSPSITAACGYGFNSGNITTTYNTGPAPACTQNSSVSNTCFCSLTPQSSTYVCPAGYFGVYNITQYVNASCNYDFPVSNQASSCAFIPNSPCTISCPSGTTYQGGGCVFGLVSSCPSGPITGLGFSYYSPDTSVNNNGAACPNNSPYMQSPTCGTCSGATPLWDGSSCVTNDPIVRVGTYYDIQGVADQVTGACSFVSGYATFYMKKSEFDELLYSAQVEPEHGPNDAQCSPGHYWPYIY